MGSKLLPAVFLMIFVGLIAAGRAAPSPFLLWEYSPGDSIQDTCVANLDGVGGEDVVVITQNGWVYGLDSDGNQLFSDSYIEEPLSKVACGNLDDDPYDEFVVTTARGPTSMFAYDNDGTMLWENRDYMAGYDAVIADLNGDGTNEIVVSGGSNVYECWGIFALTNNASPIWGGCTDEQMYDLTVNDFNGDSIKDVAGIGMGPTGSVYAVDGSDGSLLWDPLGINGVAIASGDINNDGMNEIVAGEEYYDGEDYYYYIDAINGTNGETIWKYEVDSMPIDIALGNLDDTPGLDVATIMQEVDTVYAIGGDGSLLWEDPSVSGGPSGNPRDFNIIAVADIDKDGENEVIAGGTNGVYAYESDGEEWSYTWYYGTPEPIADIEIGDVNNDGVNDVIASTPGGDSVYVLMLPPTPELLWEYSPEDSIQDTCIANLDGSKGNDVVVITQNGWVYGLDSDGNQLFNTTVFNATPPNQPGMVMGEQLSKVACGNLDDDPYGEFVVTTTAGPASIFAYDNNGTLLWENEDYIAGYDAVIADLNGDGTNEIVVSGVSNYYECLGIFALANNGSPTWGSCTGEPMYDLTVDDFNNDSIKDVAGISPSRVGTVYAVDGSNGSFLWDPLPISGVAIASGDINDDGMNEIVATDYVNEFTAPGNDYPNGDFNQPLEYSSITAINGTDGSILWDYELDDELPVLDIALGYLDDAPGLDVAAITIYPRTVYAIGGNGSLIWQDGGVGGYPEGNVRDLNLIAIADIDKDGENEVIAGGLDGVYAYEPNGNEWSYKWYYRTDETIADIEIGDVNNDGVNDVIASTPGTFSVYALTSFVYTPSQQPSEDKTFSIDETHGCAGEEMTVTVTGEKGAVTGADVKLLLTSPFVNKIGEGETDENGKISFTPSREGDYEITAQKSGYKKATLTFSITCTIGCTKDDDCSSDEKCVNNLCVPVTGECGYAANHAWVSYKCCANDDCAADEQCVNRTCTLVTGECGYAANHTWIPYECCASDDCAADEQCADHVCTLVTGECGYAANHSWVSYECCSDGDCQTGKNCVDHVCVSLPPEEAASNAIEDAQNAINEAQGGGKDVTRALEKLQEAQNAFEAGNYELAQQLAEEARGLSMAAKAQAPPTEGAGTEAVGKQAAQPVDMLGVLGGVIVLGIIVALIVGGVWLFFFKKK